MKLSHLYSNQPSVFRPIRFRDGLNVVLATIRHPKDAGKLGHNLGKTLLIDVIDFCLLKGIDKSHWLKKHPGLFGEFVFFLEVELNNGGYLTIRRSASEPTKIAFKKHDHPHQDLTELPEEDWDHWRESFKQGVNVLDSYLALSAIKPWPFRKGVGYFLRGQNDYGDVFMLSKFGVGHHQDWKPYLARILGFDDVLVSSKYDADAELDQLEKRKAELQAEVTLKPKDFDKLRASITIKTEEVASKVAALDRFDFHGQEVALAREAAAEIEQEVMDNNILLYNARHDLSHVERGLSEKLTFDLGEVRRVFEEAQLTFPDQLARDYEELTDFNHRILAERQAYLAERAKQLREEVAKVERANAILSDRRKEVLQVLGGTDSLQKFKDLQRQLDQDRASLATMEEQAARLEGLLTLLADQKEAKNRVETLESEVKAMLRQENGRYKSIQLNFNRIIKDVFHRKALLYVDVNHSGNLEFHAEFSEENTETLTEEDRGTSFKQMLCIAFDLAVLIAYAKDGFFHFVYHDGGLERLQNKLKLALFQVIRETCSMHGIQYILTSLSEDIPSHEDVDGVCPKPEEIILSLDDSGDQGRLFRMATF